MAEFKQCCFSDNVFNDLEIAFDNINAFCTEIEGKANCSDVYTKSQTDAQITAKVSEIVAGAPEDFDTLKEMSDWLSTHEDSAATMNSAISQNASDIKALEGEVDTKLDDTTKYAASDSVGGAANKVKTIVGTSNVTRGILFEDSASPMVAGDTVPSIDTAFTYNPSTNTLTVDNLNGTATQAISDGNGENIAEHFNAIENNIEEITTNVTATGTSVVLNDLQGGVPFSEVEVRDINLLYNELSSRTYNGITYTKNDDGSISLSGTATGDSWFVLVNKTLTLNKGNYIFGYDGTLFTDGITDSYYYLIRYYSTGNHWYTIGKGKDIKNVTLTVTEDNTPISLGIRVVTGDTVDCTIYPYLNRAESGLTEYVSPINGKEITLSVYGENDSYTKTFTPTESPFVLTENLEQYDGTNTLMVSAGEMSVTGVKENSALKNIWGSIDINNVDIETLKEEVDTKITHITLTTKTDLDTLKTTGIYTMKVACTNTPTSVYGTIYVDFNIGTPYQLYVTDGDTLKFYKRKYTSSTDTWNAWKTYDPTQVTQNLRDTNNANYPLLLAPSGQTATTTAGTCFDSGVTLNPSTNTITANISGTATQATLDSNGENIAEHFDAVEGSITNLEENISSINTAIGENQSNIGINTNAISVLNNNVSSLQTGLSATVNRVSTNEADIAINKTTLGYQKKNLMKLLYSSGYTVSNTAKTVTWTFNNDYSISMAVTTKLTSGQALEYSKVTLKPGTYIYSVAGYSTPSVIHTQLYKINADGSSAWQANLSTIENTITVTEETTYSFRVYRNSAVTAGTTETIYPMLRYADIVDSTFEPYVESIDERLNALLARIEALEAALQ